MTPSSLSMDARIAAIERQFRGIPSRWGGSVNPYVLSTGQGNLISTLGSTNYYGLKYPAADVLTVPTVAPAFTAGGSPDGLTAAILMYNGTATYFVWMGTRVKPPGAASAITQLGGSIYYRTPVLSFTMVALPLVSDANVLVPVYIPFRL